MPAPATSLLDDFNRANNASLGANWSEGVIGTTTRAEISGNQVTTAGSGGSSCCAYTTGPSGNNIAMTATVTGFLVSAADDNLGHCAAKVSDTTQGYRIEYDSRSGDNITHFIRTDGTVIASVTCTGMGAIAVGDITGLIVNDNGSTALLEFWLFRSGTWTLYASATGSGASYIAGPYYPGIRVKYDTDFLDNFGGANVVTSPGDDPPIGILGRGAGW